MIFEKIFQKILEITQPDRNLEAVKIGRKMYTVTHDSFERFDYSLQGKYSYEKVKELNELTDNFAVYGYCEKKGPVAIIGLSKLDDNARFFNEVSAYGEWHSLENYELKRYSEDVAKQISNYTVYGASGLKEIADFVKFEKINSAFDYRHIVARYSHEYRVLKMKAKLEGIYTFEEAKYLAKNQERWAIDRGIAFATLENGEHIAIMSFWYKKKDEVAGFRDVWEAGKAEPPVQKITFLTDEEASEIRDYSIYMYDYAFLYKMEDAPEIVKLDYSFEPGFDFYNTPDGKDLRLSKEF